MFVIREPSQGIISLREREGVRRRKLRKRCYKRRFKRRTLDSVQRCVQLSLNHVVWKLFHFYPCHSLLNPPFRSSASFFHRLYKSLYTQAREYHVAIWFVIFDSLSVHMWSSNHFWYHVWFIKDKKDRMSTSCKQNNKQMKSKSIIHKVFLSSPLSHSVKIHQVRLNLSAIKDRNMATSIIYKLVFHH